MFFFIVILHVVLFYCCKASSYLFCILMCRSLAAENHVGFRYEVGNNGDFATPRHAASAGEGGQDCSVGAHTTERGRVQRLEPCFFFDNKLEP